MSQATVSAAQVKALRDRTGQPMMDCKKALIESGGDMEKAVEILRSRGKGVADKRVDKEAAEGRIAVWVEGDRGGIVELRCESAPVAKTEQFIALAEDLARQAAFSAAKTVEEFLQEPFVGDKSKTVKERIEDTMSLIREKMEVARFQGLQGGQIGSYVHHDGTVAVLVQVEGDQADPQLLRDICMHITATDPLAATREDVPEDVIAHERQIAVAQTQEDPKMQGKPQEIIERAAEGKVNKWLAQNILVDQPFVKDESTKVGELLKKAGLKLKSFVRFKVGEKKS